LLGCSISPSSFAFSGGPRLRLCRASSPRRRSCSHSRWSAQGLQRPSRTRGSPEFASIYFSAPEILTSCEVAALLSALASRRASTLSRERATWSAVPVISPHRRAGCSRARNPRTRDRASWRTLRHSLNLQHAGTREVPRKWRRQRWTVIMGGGGVGAKAAVGP
jgi:hypothetical protein